LSGPSHAEEVARNIPTTVVAASRKPHAAEMIQKLFMTPYFRVYSHADVVGVELGGALKNVIALAAGICDGVGFGDNTKAALITRGLAEITRLGVAMGANALTFAGLSGMGDLIVTCMSRHSRNRYVGEQIGKGKRLEEVLAKMHMVAEGVRTTKAAHKLAQKHKIEMPITEKVHAVLFEGTQAKTAVAELMAREAKAEKWGY
jgi:glycerol-3-phosphate dehydrogenase (NAD(P)+)